MSTFSENSDIATSGTERCISRSQISTILLVEDNPGDARLVCELLLGEKSNIDIRIAPRLSEAVALVQATKFDAVVLDLSLPDSVGMETLKQMLAAAPGVPVVVLTGLDDEAVGDEAVELGAQSYLVKGQYDGQLLLRTIRHACERQRLIAQLVSEISLRCEAQQALERANDQLERNVLQRTAELSSANRALSMLSQSNHALLHAEDESGLLRTICELIVTPGNYPLVWVGTVEHDDHKSIVPVAVAGEDQGFMETVRFGWGDDNLGQGAIGTAVREGRHIVDGEVLRSKAYQPWQARLESYGFDGVIALPLYENERLTNILVIYTRQAENFDSDENELLTEIAADLSFGITTLRASIEREKERQELIKFSSALKQADDIVIITDTEGVINYVNPAFERVSGYNAIESFGKTPGELVKSEENQTEDRGVMWQSLLRGEPYHGTFINRSKNGGLYYEQKTITPIKDGGGEVIYFLSTGKDITHDLQMQERLRNLLNYDILSGLPNRSLFFDRLNQLWEQSQWERRLLSIAIINIDRFKNINSSLGHEVGDEVLRTIAHRLKLYFRHVDTVARLVGNTFAVILIDQVKHGQIMEIARDMLSLIAKPCQIGDKEIAVNACVGVSIAVHDGENAHELVRNAEAAMYKAKQRGPNQIEFYNKSINAYSANTLAMEIALRHALDRKEFILYYQPKIDLAASKIVGVEALIRWQQPERGLVSPAEFIPLLEQTGLIVPVGQWVLEEACRQLRAWDDAGVPQLQMGLNLSPRQFLHDRLIDDFYAFFNRYGIDSVAGRLELEITESSFMHDLEHGVSTLQRLKELGLRIAIDDFGTGYSSLSYLSRLPVDVLKIDRSFINNIPERTDDVEVVRAIIALAKSLNLHVVAEGVENIQQQDFLVKQGCDLAQGFYYSMPQSADKLMPYLKSSVAKH